QRVARQLPTTRGHAHGERRGSEQSEVRTNETPRPLVGHVPEQGDDPPRDHAGPALPDGVVRGEQGARLADHVSPVRPVRRWRARSGWSSGGGRDAPGDGEGGAALRRCGAAGDEDGERRDQRALSFQLEFHGPLTYQRWPSASNAAAKVE